jgi:cysteinyl-tRNA synthetase
VRELLEQAPGEAIRLALLSGHYRHPLDWTSEVLPDAKRKLDRLYQTLRDLPDVADASGEPDPDFVAALEDDLNTPKALAALFDLARDLNRSEAGPARLELAGRLKSSAALLGILRESPADWFMRGTDGELDAARVEALLADRRDARARRDFAAADRIRDELIRGGILIEDGPEGTRWRRAG